MTAVRVLRGNAQLGMQIEPATIVIEDDRIAAVQRGHERDGNFGTDVRVDDVELISAGLIDLQVNGAKNAEIGDSAKAIDHVSSWLPESGVTAWLPTVVTAAASFYPGVFDAWQHLSSGIGATPLGYHLEGPFFSTEKKGAHRIELIESADDSILDAWLDEPSVRLVTLAPERSGALDRIRKLTERGIVVSLGHTNANYEAFLAGVDAGATKTTHLFNTMPAIHHREPGAMVAALNDSRITAGIIPDGVHSHPGMLQLARLAKGADRLLVVSDMMSAAGLDPGTYALGGQQVTVDASSARLDDGTLAGSVITMDAAVRNLVRWSVATLPEALHMCTSVPARVIGDPHRGQLRVGTIADIAIWDRDLEIQETTVAGERRFFRT